MSFCKQLCKVDLWRIIFELRNRFVVPVTGCSDSSKHSLLVTCNIAEVSVGKHTLTLRADLALSAMFRVS